MWRARAWSLVLRPRTHGTSSIALHVALQFPCEQVIRRWSCRSHDRSMPVLVTTYDSEVCRALWSLSRSKYAFPSLLVLPYVCRSPPMQRCPSMNHMIPVCRSPPMQRFPYADHRPCRLPPYADHLSCRCTHGSSFLQQIRLHTTSFIDGPLRPWRRRASGCEARRLHQQGSRTSSFGDLLSLRPPLPS